MHHRFNSQPAIQWIWFCKKKSQFTQWVSTRDAVDTQWGVELGLGELDHPMELEGLWFYKPNEQLSRWYRWTVIICYFVDVNLTALLCVSRGVEVIEKLLKQQGMDWLSEMDTLLKIGKATKDNKGGDKPGNYQTAKEKPFKVSQKVFRIYQGIWWQHTWRIEFCCLILSNHLFQ